MSEIRDLEVDCRERPAHVEVRGAGPDVVLVGTAVPMAWSRPAAVALAESGFRVTNFDYGSGASDPLPRTALDQVADVIEVMRAVGAGKGIVVGLSRGAITAYGLAARAPELVAGLVLAFPVAGWADNLFDAEPDPTPEPGENEDSFVYRSLRRVFSEEFLASRLDDAVALVTTSPGSVVRVARDEEEAFSEDAFVDCPVLVIEGGRDEVVTSEHAERYRQALTQANHEVVESATHGWVMEEPQQFAALISRFAGASGLHRL